MGRQHARELLARGHEVRLLYPMIGRGVPGADNRDVPLHSPVLPVHEYLPGVTGEQRQVALMDTAEAFAYAADYTAALNAAAGGVDLIIGHHASISAAAVARVGRSRGIPYVIFVHGTAIEPMHRGGYTPTVWAEIEAAIRHAAGIIVTTEYVRDSLVRPVVGVPAERFLVLPCGVDLAELRPERAGDVPRRYRLPAEYVISPGAVTWLKGAHNVVRATERYADLAPTIFIGDGDLRTELEPLLGNRGRFLGCVSDADKAGLINGASILVAAPEKKEHFGIAYVEGLAAGAVPVAYGGGGVDTIVTPDVGILTERNPAVLGDAVRGLLADPDRRSELAAAGRRRAADHFDRAVLGGRLVDWLEGIVALRSGGPMPALSPVAATGEP